MSDAATWTRAHRIKCESPGSFLSEEATYDVSERTVEAALAIVPLSAFRFRFYDALTATVWVEGEEQTVSKTENHSPWHYLGGTLYDAEEVEAMGHDILLSNMQANHWDQVIHTPKGNWHPWESDFIYVAVDPS